MMVSIIVLGNKAFSIITADRRHSKCAVLQPIASRHWSRKARAYEFAENSDFVVFAEIGGNPLGGRPAKEHAISLDMAKELAMVERNERGKQARRVTGSVTDIVTASNARV